MNKTKQFLKPWTVLVMMVFVLIVTPIVAEKIGIKDNVVFAAETEGDFQYELINNDTEVKITKYTGNEEVIYLPNQLGEKPVVEIGDFAFSGNQTMATIWLNDGLKTINKGAFNSCSSLIGITIPGSVENIYSTHWSDERTFGNCTALENVVIGNKVKAIPEACFYECSNLMSIKVGNSVTDIGNNAFYNCSKINNVKLPNSVKNIGVQAFMNCASLTNINLGNGLNTIDRGAFNNCSSLTGITIPDSVENIYSTYWSDERTFGNCTALKNVAIGNKVKAIPEDCFYECTNLTSIKVGNSVTDIGNNAFYNCSKINNVKLPNSVKNIGVQAFMNCSSLTNINLGNGLNTIDRGAFNNCSSLTGITIPDSVENIYSTYWSDERTFGNCTALKNVVIGNKVKAIPEDCFYECTNLTSIKVGNSVTDIGNNAFYNCSKINNVKLSNSVKNIGVQAFMNCSSLTNINLGNGLNTIDRGAFNNCSSLTGITIPDSVENIYSTYWSDERTFGNCTALKNVVIGNKVKAIPEDCFYECTNLTSITIGSNIKEISSQAFYGDTKLSKVYFLGNAPALGEDAFGNCASNLKLYYKSGATGFSNLSYPCGVFNSANTHKQVTFNVNGGSSSNSKSLTEKGKTISEAVKPLKTGYTFVGWYKNPAGTGDKWDFSKNVVTTDITLYAKWQVNTYSITFNPTGGTVNKNKMNIIYNNGIGNLPTPVRKGYVFMGWYPGLNGAGPQYTSKTKMPAYNLTLYAKWKVDTTYSITFNPAGGKVSTSKKNVSYNNSIGSLPTPVREGYVFMGWYSGLNGAGTQYTSKTKMPAYNLILYAKWKVNTYSITFNPTGGTVNKNKMNVIYNNGIGNLPTPVRKGYVFMGWYTGLNGAGSQYTSKTKMPAYNLTLYAKWKVK